LGNVLPANFCVVILEFSFHPDSLTASDVLERDEEYRDFIFVSYYNLFLC
jgi:hypothetical protein